MTAPSEPVHRSADATGKLWYTHPLRKEPDGTPERYISVSTTCDGLDKAGLVPWAGKLAGQTAVDEVPRIIAAMLEPECGRTYGAGSAQERCRKCLPCVARWIGEEHARESLRARDRGSAVHHVLRMWISTGAWIAHDPDIGPFIAGLRKWITDHKLTPADFEASECTVIHRTLGYAGTLDLIVTIHASRTEASALFVAKATGRLSGTVTVVVDLKTRDRDPDDPGAYCVYPTVALQISAYRHAEWVLLDDGRELPMPATGGGAVLQVGRGWYRLEPVVADDMTFEGFKGTLRAMNWLHTWGDRAVGVSSFRVPDEVAGTAAGHRRVIEERRAAGYTLLLKEADRRDRSVGRPRPARAARKATTPAGQAPPPAAPAAPAPVASRRAAAVRSRIAPGWPASHTVEEPPDLPF